MKIEVYTDGACSGNPGPGGYGIVIRSNNSDVKMWGSEEKTTNNRMELKAVVEGLRHALLVSSDEKKVISIFSDSAYIVHAINQGWVLFWKSNDWKKKDGNEVKNKDLWERLIYLIDKSKSRGIVYFVKVKGHNGNPFNELADSLAKMAIKDLNASKAPSKR